MPSQAPPLDEVQWRNPHFIAESGLHSNSILFYFADSPFFDMQSKNGTFITQAMHNYDVMALMATRESFEAALRKMSGLEYIVHQEPAETGPGMGTGVWVIRKQTRTKVAGKQDELVVHADYFICGENVYQAPSFADIMTSRLATISSTVDSLFDTAQTLRHWTPSQGHIYKTTIDPLQSATSGRPAASRGTTPMPNSQGPELTNPKQDSSQITSRLASESMQIQLRYGGDYMDENAILGRPGEFHFASTGRKDHVLAPPPAAAGLQPNKANGQLGLGAVAKVEGSPRTPTTPMPGKPKRRKSKAAGVATPS